MSLKEVDAYIKNENESRQKKSGFIDVSKIDTPRPKIESLGGPLDVPHESLLQDGVVKIPSRFYVAAGGEHTLSVPEVNFGLVAAIFYFEPRFALIAHLPQDVYESHASQHNLVISATSAVKGILAKYGASSAFSNHRVALFGATQYLTDVNRAEKVQSFEEHFRKFDFNVIDTVKEGYAGSQTKFIRQWKADVGKGTLEVLLGKHVQFKSRTPQTRDPQKISDLIRANHNTVQTKTATIEHLRVSYNGLVRYKLTSDIPEPVPLT